MESSDGRYIFELFDHATLCACDQIAESFYYVKYGSSIITSKNLSEILSNGNKHSVFTENLVSITENF